VIASRIRQHFDARAPHYDNPVTAFIGERELRCIRCRVPAGATVLDYGCGTGRTTLDLLQRGCTVTAYDLSPEMLALAQAKTQRAGWSAEFTADDTSLVGRVWPVVTCIGVLDYYADPVPLLQTVASYLAPGGRLVVTYPNALSPLGWLYALVSRWTFPAIPRTPAFAWRAAERAGLRVISLDYAFPALPPFGQTLVLALAQLDAARWVMSHDQTHPAGR
jgi:2-polyprenyl-3-methyl-5-hydroxy-6-metoxy-1,4-benzoquinol methylase